MNQYIEEDLTRDEEALVKKTWRQWCRDSTRGQILETMKDNRDMCSLIYDVCHAELLVRDRADDKSYALSERKRVWNGATPKQRLVMAKRRKLDPKVKYITF